MQVSPLSPSVKARAVRAGEVVGEGGGEGGMRGGNHSGGWTLPPPSSRGHLLPFTAPPALSDHNPASATQAN